MDFNNLYLIVHQNYYLYLLTVISILILISIAMYLIATKLILTAVQKMFIKTSTKIDDILINKKIFHRLANIIPALVFYNFSYTLPNLEMLIKRISLSMIAIITIIVINLLLDALGDIYSKTKYSEKLHIKSYLQVGKLIINFLGAIIIISILIGQNPAWLISGLGAMTAVLMLIFKDTILSLVASLQISSNNLFKLGDWIEAPQFGADGDIIDIALHTVKIQNWDKTISIIPTHKLIDSTFRNWKGMSDSGGRRIKRSLYIDINSISFCTKEMISKFKEFDLLKDYIEQKQIELEKYNSNKISNNNNLVNCKHLTNIGTFRKYIELYLKQNKNIHDHMTFLIRQLEPTSKGLPIQIYVFSNDTNWIKYEGIQGDIFDHLLAIIPEFNLKIFQNPTGQDFNKALKV